MAPENGAARSPEGPDAKRRREDLETSILHITVEGDAHTNEHLIDPRIYPNAATPALRRENATIGTPILPADATDEFWATFNRKDKEDEGKENADAEEGEDSREDDEDDHENKDESEEDVEASPIAATSPVGAPPNSVHSYKPTSAWCPKAAMRNAASNDIRGPAGSKSGSEIPHLTGASRLSKGVQSPLANKPTTKMQEPEDDRKIAIKAEIDSSANHTDISQQDDNSSNPSALAHVVSEPPSFTPFSHKPIFVNEPGHGRFKSRVVFEADTILPEQHYAEIVPANNRMTALQKLKAWRETFGIKTKDNQLRKAERLVILNEGVPSMARNELSLYTDTLKGIGKWLKQFMPDSFIVIKTTIPASTHTRAGRFRAYMEALYQLMENYSFHFSVEIEDKSILATNVTTNTQDGVPEELAFALNFVHSVEFFRQWGHLMAGDQKPFSSIRPKKKQNKTTYGSLDPHHEAEVVTTYLPWIPEQLARNFYANCVAFPDEDFGDLEFEQTGPNAEALMPQERIGFIASMDRSLFANPGLADLGPSNQM
ncbi:hypothetical protein P171DRAFT_475403 [Karstenula rhodostoma CBS 690.94]|uniref:Uncharacterized protein n=1 Tax=Karstenula rhodostoma CBS 690.94 TaxID=1392251 RepID=A0A9P4U8H6_9PLEO|nr:hypothetical protein P171DRAFT_475403 [Karstenula rhodostoma CBS 690.94]